MCHQTAAAGFSAGSGRSSSSTFVMSVATSAPVALSSLRRERSARAAGSSVTSADSNADQSWTGVTGVALMKISWVWSRR